MSQAGLLDSSCPKVLIALGSNATTSVNASMSVLMDSIEQLKRVFCAEIAVSRLFQTPCFPANTGPDFANAAISLHSAMDPICILQRLHEIESQFGRERPSRWAPRTLDLDLLAVGQQIAPSRAVLQEWIDMPLSDQVKRAPDELILPHPRLQDRAFVLIPLADIAADWRHPATGLSVSEMVEALPEEDKNAVTPIE